MKRKRGGTMNNSTIRFFDTPADAKNIPSNGGRRGKKEEGGCPKLEF